jgi:hypothetical protein
MKAKQLQIQDPLTFIAEIGDEGVRQSLTSFPRAKCRPIEHGLDRVTLSRATEWKEVLFDPRTGSTVLYRLTNGVVLLRLPADMEPESLWSGTSAMWDARTEEEFDLACEQNLEALGWKSEVSQQPPPIAVHTTRLHHFSSGHFLARALSYYKQ